MVKLPAGDQFPASSSSCTYRVWGPSGDRGEFGVYEVLVVAIAPLPRFALFSLYCHIPLPLSVSPEVHVHVGVVSLVGVIPETAGAPDASVSTTMTHTARSDQLPASSHS